MSPVFRVANTFRKNIVCVCVSQSAKMSKFHVYVTRRVPQKGIDLMKPFCHITQWDSDAPVTRAELLKNVKGMDALFCLLTDKIDMEVIKTAGDQLKVIGTMSVGFDHIDLPSCRERGIAVGYTPDVLTDATAELTVALLLAVSRRLIEGVEAVKSGAWGTWSPLWLCGPTLKGSTVGIVGLGRIGQAVAARLQPFGVKRLLYTGRSPSPNAHELDAHFVNFDDLLKESDFVIATCALADETKGMFNKAAFSMMKNSTIFVNTSRGGVVNQEDLYDAIVSGTIAAAGLDVTTPEPLPTDSPLLSLPNCVVLPHIGSATTDTRSQMSELCAKNILAALHGQTMPAQLK